MRNLTLKHAIVINLINVMQENLSRVRVRMFIFSCFVEYTADHEKVILRLKDFHHEIKYINDTLSSKIKKPYNHRMMKILFYFFEIFYLAFKEKKKNRIRSFLKVTNEDISDIIIFN